MIDMKKLLGMTLVLSSIGIYASEQVVPNWHAKVADIIAATGTLSDDMAVDTAKFKALSKEAEDHFPVFESRKALISSIKSCVNSAFNKIDTKSTDCANEKAAFAATWAAEKADLIAELATLKASNQSQLDALDAQIAQCASDLAEAQSSYDSIVDTNGAQGELLMSALLDLQKKYRNIAKERAKFKVSYDTICSRLENLVSHANVELGELEITFCS